MIEGILKQAPILAIAIPLLMSTLIPLIGKKHAAIRNTLAFLGPLGSVGVLALLINPVFVGGEKIVYILGGRIPPFGINLVVDGLSLLLAVLVSGLTLLAVIYSYKYMKKYTGLVQYYALVQLLLAGMNGIILTGDMFNLFVFLEIMAIAAYALVAFTIGKEQVEAAFKFQVLSTIGTLGVLIGIALLYAITGTLNMANLAQRIALVGQSPILSFALVFFILGFGLKAAMVPLHSWLPDAHPAAPSPISALLSGVVIKTGVYGLARTIFTVFGVSMVAIHPLLLAVLALGVATMVVGGLMAMVQVDIKRMLAFSSISQIGYILFGIGMATGLAVSGAIFHVLNHAVMKALLFMCAGVIVYRIGTRNMDKLGGLAGKMPVTAFGFLVGGLAIAGIPPFNGFWSKLMLYIAGFQSGNSLAAVVSIVMSVVTLGYFLRFFQQIFLGKLPKSLEDVKEAPLSMLLPIVILILACILMGLYPQYFMKLSQSAANALFDQTGYIRGVLG